MVTGDGTETRRELLRTGASGLAALTTVGSAGLGLSACGGSSAPRRHGKPSGPGEGDVDLLNSVLSAEQRAIAAYTAVTPLLSGEAQKAAGRFLEQDLAHAGELRALIKRAGGHPREPESSYSFGPTGHAHVVLGLLHRLEQAQIAAYQAALPIVSTRLLRAALSSMMANDAQHIVVLRSALGLPALTGAFLTATS